MLPYYINPILSDNKNQKGEIKNLIFGSIKDFIYKDLFSPRTETDVVSNNAKVVLYGLFALIGFVILLYAITVAGLPERVERLEQLEQINAVYVAAISGALALGGTLIAQLWGRD
jgi:hypothetical protein